MTKEVKIVIEGSQEGDGDSVVTTKTTGRYHYRNGKHYIQYEEPLEDGTGTSMNTIIIATGQLDLKKEGKLKTHMSFCLEESTLTEYPTPYGSLMLRILTEEMGIAEEENEISVLMRYNLSENNNLLSKNLLKISITAI